MAEGGQSEGAMEIIPVALNSTILDVDGARIRKNTGEIGYGG